MARTAQQMRSVRIDIDIDQQLRRLSEEIGVSVNSLASRALHRYAEWDSFAEKFGFVDMPAFIFSRMMSYLTEDELRGVGRWLGAELLREYITFRYKEVSLNTVLAVMPALFSKYGRLFEYEQMDERGRRTLVIKHGGGSKVSAFWEELIRAAFKDLLHLNVTVESMEQQVVARFSVPGGEL